MPTWPDSPTRHPSEQPQRSEEQLTGRLTETSGNVRREAQHASLVGFSYAASIRAADGK
jgi:hypothetical protein